MQLYTVIDDSPNGTPCILKICCHHFANGCFLVLAVGHEVSQIPSVVPKVEPLLMRF